MRHECFPMQASLSFIVKHCVSSPPFSPSNVWVIQYSDVSTFAQIPAWGWVGTCPRENYVATFTFILTLQVKTFDLGTGNTTFTIRYVFMTQSSLLLV